MRSKLIIMGGIGVMAAATLTVNAQNAVQHLGARPVSATLLAPHSIDTDRQNVTIAVRASESAEATESAKPEASEATKPEESRPAVAQTAVSDACRAAIGELKTLHQKDVTEDASERTTSNDESAAAIASDKSEDISEATDWVAALKAARTACLPQLPVRCEAAISGLQAVFMALRAQEAAEPQVAGEMDAAADFGAVRTAFSTIATTCAARD